MSRRQRPRGRSQQRGGSSFRIPWVPAAVVLVLGVVVAIVAVAVLQSGGSSGDDDDAIVAEADRSTDLPGEFVDLIEIYGGPYPETAGHVSRQIDYAADGNSNPPTGGPHWSGGCGDDPSSAPAFCGPAPWGVFRQPWDPETLVHNMEHAGVVVWYNTADPDVLADLEAVVTERLEDDLLIVLTPYTEMEDDTIAITSWSRIDKFSASEYEAARVEAFIDAHERRFNPEGS